MKQLSALLLTLLSVQAYATCGGETTLRVERYVYTQACMTPGYCQVNGGSYGYQSCPGTQTWTDYKYWCQRRDGSTYIDFNPGWWTDCRIQGQ